MKINEPVANWLFWRITANKNPQEVVSFKEKQKIKFIRKMSGFLYKFLNTCIPIHLHEKKAQHELKNEENQSKERCL